MQYPATSTNAKLDRSGIALIALAPPLACLLACEVATCIYTDYVMESLESAARDVEGRCLGMALRRASRAVTQRYDEALAQIGLRSTQFSVLVGLAHAPEVPLSRLAAALVMDRTTLTRNLAPLLRDGLVEERAAADGRVRLFALTGKGKKTFERALPAWETAQSHMVRALAEHVAPLTQGLSRAVVAARSA